MLQASVSVRARTCSLREHSHCHTEPGSTDTDRFCRSSRSTGTAGVTPRAPPLRQGGGSSHHEASLGFLPDTVGDEGNLKFPSSHLPLLFSCPQHKAAPPVCPTGRTSPCGEAAAGPGTALLCSRLPGGAAGMRAGNRPGALLPVLPRAGTQPGALTAFRASSSERHRPALAPASFPGGFFPLFPPCCFRCGGSGAAAGGTCSLFCFRSARSKPSWKMVLEVAMGAGKGTGTGWQGAVGWSRGASSKPRPLLQSPRRAFGTHGGRPKPWRARPGPAGATGEPHAPHARPPCQSPPFPGPTGDRVRATPCPEPPTDFPSPDPRHLSPSLRGPRARTLTGHGQSAAGVGLSQSPAAAAAARGAPPALAHQLPAPGTGTGSAGNRGRSRRRHRDPERERRRRGGAGLRARAAAAHWLRPRTRAARAGCHVPAPPRRETRPGPAHRGAGPLRPRPTERPRPSRRDPAPYGETPPAQRHR